MRPLIFGYCPGLELCRRRVDRIQRILCSSLLVTRQAFLVVGGWVIHQIFVRVVAGDARQADVAFAPAFAALQAIRLEARGDDAAGAIEHHIAPGTMASAAEIDRGNRIERARVEDRAAAGVDVARFHVGDMARAWPVTRFAGDAGSQRGNVEMIRGSGRGGVAAETALGFGGSHPAAHGGF